MEEIDSNSCKGKHSSKDLKNMSVIKSTENMVRLFASDLFEYSIII